MKERKLTKSQLAVYNYIVRHTKVHGEVWCSKKELAQAVGIGLRTADRAVTFLRREGMIGAVPHHAEDGSQIFNSYKATGS